MLNFYCRPGDPYYFHGVYLRDMWYGMSLVGKQIWVDGDGWRDLESITVYENSYGLHDVYVRLS